MASVLLNTAILTAATSSPFGHNNTLGAIKDFLPLRTLAKIRLRERDWWHARIDLSAVGTSRPLAVSLQDVHSDRCSEGTNADGTCRFGLKVFGSARAPKHVQLQVLDKQLAVGGSCHPRIVDCLSYCVDMTSPRRAA